jgi:hypothetical protein
MTGLMDALGKDGACSLLGMGYPSACCWAWACMACRVCCACCCRAGDCCCRLKGWTSTAAVAAGGREGSCDRPGLQLVQAGKGVASPNLSAAACRPLSEAGDDDASGAGAAALAESAQLRLARV